MAGMETSSSRSFQKTSAQQVPQSSQRTSLTSLSLLLNPLFKLSLQKVRPDMLRELHGVPLGSRGSCCCQRWCSSLSTEDPKRLVVYASAAPGNLTVYLSQLFLDCPFRVVESHRLCHRVERQNRNPSRILHWSRLTRVQQTLS